jgi:hypothetical protein
MMKVAVFEAKRESRATKLGTKFLSLANSWTKMDRIDWIFGWKNLSREFLKGMALQNSAQNDEFEFLNLIHPIHPGLISTNFS